MSLTTNQVNYLNIGLMILSCALAFRFPFELFLFSYAILGPLHYLTEISWLHERKYFTEGKSGKSTKRAHRGWLILVALTMGVLIAVFVVVEGAGVKASPKWEITFLYLVFVAALLVTVIRDRTARAITLIASLVLLFLLGRTRYYIIFALLLVTMIHVLIFTGTFILYGALKSRSRSGFLSMIVFVACAISFFIYVPEGRLANDYIRQSYRSFNVLNSELISLFNLGPGTKAAEVYESQGGLMIMRMIAFAYTYHYLNWFSKTSIIKWHEVPKARIAFMAVIWLGTLGLYAYDYDTGMAVLYFMSILHVMLEFPLNHRTFTGIGKEMYAMAR